MLLPAATLQPGLTRSLLLLAVWVCSWKQCSKSLQQLRTLQLQHHLLAVAWGMSG
jgi:hypothetical protein